MKAKYQFLILTFFFPAALPLWAQTAPVDDLYLSKNAFRPSAQESVSIYAATTRYPGEFSVKVYNSAGEHIRTFTSENLSGPAGESFTWDGTNKYGDGCASGIYIFRLREPLGIQEKRVLLIR